MPDTGGPGEPWDPRRLRRRLTARLAFPADPAAQAAQVRLAAAAILAAVPVTVWCAVPIGVVRAGAVLGLLCATLPGILATWWTAAGLREERRAAVGALCQAGEDEHAAWMMTLPRPVLAAGPGALCGTLAMTALRGQLAARLPRQCALRAVLTAQPSAWSATLPLAVLAVTAWALASGSPARPWSPAR